MNTLISFVLKLGLMRKIVVPLVGIYAKTKGYKTQGLCIAAGMVYLCGFFGWISLEDAKKYAETLLLVAIPTAGDKLERIAKYAGLAKAELDKASK